jgi:hypothetical protein
MSSSQQSTLYYCSSFLLFFLWAFACEVRFFLAGCVDILVSSSKMWFFPFWKWMHHTPPKHWYILTMPNDITSHKTVILSFSLVCCILAIMSLFLDLWYSSLCPSILNKGKVVPVPSIKGYSRSGNIATLILSASAVDGGVWSTSLPVWPLEKVLDRLGSQSWNS